MAVGDSPLLPTAPPPRCTVTEWGQRVQEGTDTLLKTPDHKCGPWNIILALLSFPRPEAKLRALAPTWAVLALSAGPEHGVPGSVHCACQLALQDGHRSHSADQRWGCEEDHWVDLWARHGAGDRQT